MNSKTVWTLALLASALFACGDDGSDPADAVITLHPMVATGAPLDAPAGVWTYVDFANTTCRDGSPAGIAVRRSTTGSKKLMIYLEGGGSCFDAVTCLVNPTNTELFKVEKTAGLFNTQEPKNPVRDWNMVYVPYCSGDTHGGTRHDVVVPDVAGVQQFTGYTNIYEFLQRIAPTFSDASDVLLTGVSAGGYGAAQNAVQVANAFPNVKMTLIDDSGPGFSTAAMPSCLQTLWRDTYGFEDSFLKDCGKACPDHDDFVQDYAIAITRSFQDRPSGMIESLQDGTISRFLAKGNINCTGRALADQVPLEIFSADLLAYREKVAKYPNFGTYLPTSMQHTWLGEDTLFKASSGGVNLIDWVTRIVSGQAPGNAGP